MVCPVAGMEVCVVEKVVMFTESDEAPMMSVAQLSRPPNVVAIALR